MNHRQRLCFLARHLKTLSNGVGRSRWARLRQNVHSCIRGRDRWPRRQRQTPITARAKLLDGCAHTNVCTASRPARPPLYPMHEPRDDINCSLRVSAPGTDANTPSPHRTGPAAGSPRGPSALSAWTHGLEVCSVDPPVVLHDDRGQSAIGPVPGPAPGSRLLHISSDGSGTSWRGSTGAGSTSTAC